MEAELEAAMLRRVGGPTPDRTLRQMYATIPSSSSKPGLRELMLRFWRDVILIDATPKVLDAHSCCTIDAAALADRLALLSSRQQDMPVVLRSLIASGDIIREDEWRHGRSWMQFTATTTISITKWLWGFVYEADEDEGGSVTGRWVLRQRAETLAQKLLDRCFEELGQIQRGVDVLSMAEVVRVAREHVDAAMPESDVCMIVDHLAILGKVVVRVTERDTIVKFRPPTDHTPIELTEDDMNVFQLHTTLVKARQQLQDLERDYDKRVAEAKAAYARCTTQDQKLRVAQKNLQRKRIITGAIETRVDILHKLEAMFLTVTTSRQNVHVLQALTSGSETIKNLLQSISLDDVDSVMEQAQDATADASDFSRAIAGQSYGEMNLDDDEIEKELDELLAMEQSSSSAQNTPEPATSTETPPLHARSLQTQSPRAPPQQALPQQKSNNIRQIQLA